MISLKCFFKGHEFKKVIKSTSHESVYYLICTRCPKSVVTWSENVQPNASVA